MVTWTRTDIAPRRETNLPEVSILMGFYNAESTLARALESLLGQSLLDWEAIVVNDGSTDASREIADEFARKDKRIKVIHFADNRGLPVALNVALKEARAPIVARQDADDLSYPSRLEEQLEYLTANKNVAVLGTWMHLLDGEGQVWGRFGHRQLPK